MPLSFTKCSSCNASIPPDSEFCPYCGAERPFAVNKTNPLGSTGKGSSLEVSDLDAEVEKTVAIMNRMVALEDEKKYKKKKRIISVFGVIAVIAILIIVSSISSSINGKSRNFATETMHRGYNNVYADVVSIKPVYFVYHSNKADTITLLSSVICKCTTVEGETIWVAITDDDFPGGISNIHYKGNGYEPLLYSEEHPKHIVGRVRPAGDIEDDLEDEIGDIFVLYAKTISD